MGFSIMDFFLKRCSSKYSLQFVSHDCRVVSDVIFEFHIQWMYSISIVESTQSALMESKLRRHSVTKRFFYILSGEVRSRFRTLSLAANDTDREFYMARWPWPDIVRWSWRRQARKAPITVYPRD